MARVLIPIPAQDSDPSEVAVSWQVLTQRGHQVRFATPEGRRAQADELMISGEGLDPWSWIPGLRRLVVIGRLLRADADARAAYAALQRAPEFRTPLRWDEIRLAEVDGILLPGGHRARGMRAYLESEVLQARVAEAFELGMPVAAICHGVLLAARSTDPATGHSVLYGRATTSLTWQLERTAWQVGRLARFWDGGYYRTYTETSDQPAGYMSVQSEVTRALAAPEDFKDVSADLPDAARQRSGRHRDTLEDARPAFIVEDRGYLSARWPGDVHTFAARFAEMLTASASASAPAPAPAAGS